MTLLRRLIAVVLVVVIPLASGCTRRNTVVRHPDAPMLILKPAGMMGRRVRVAVYDAEKNQLIEAGTVNVADLSGWTLRKFDWERFIAQRRGRR